MSQFPPAIEHLIEEGYSFDFGRYISEGFNMAKENLGLFIGFGFAFLAITIGAGLIPVLGSLASGLIITPCLTVGLYLVADKIAQGQQPIFNNFFDGSLLKFYTFVMIIF